MTAVKDMTLEEAAGTAISLLVADIEGKYREKGTTWQEVLFAEWDAEEFADLYNNGSIWQEAKYEGSETSFEGLTAKVVAEYGGEGKGDQYWMVISLSDSDTTRYFRMDGWYASYDGGTLDGDPYEVHPAEKVVVVYQ